MSIQLRKEQNEYIDKILSKGLDEIINAPSFDNSIISNNNDYNLKNNSMKINQLNLKIPTSNDFNISEEIRNNHKNILLNNIEEEKKDIFYNSMKNNKYNFDIYKNINYKLRQKTLDNKEENKSDLIISYIPNNNEIIENALWNNQKNINKLNKQITGDTLTSSQNSNYKKKADLSISTQNLIDKYIDLKSSTYSLLNELKDNNDKNNNEGINIQDLSCINKINETKKDRNKKYYPKSSALKNLIEKLKKEEEYEESRNRNNNDNIIQVSSFADSGLFTLGNSNITSSTEKTKIKKEKKEKRNKSKKEHKKFRYKSELNSDMLRQKNIRTFDKIMDSEHKNDKINTEIDLIRDKIRKISHNLKIEKNSNIHKNYSMKSLIKSDYGLKNSYYNIYSVLSMGNISNIKNKKRRAKSINMNNYIKIIKEENDYMIKYKELRNKFEFQREKMKKEKDNVITFQQKIKVLEKKFEKYIELIEFNKTLKEQNYILLNNLNYSDDVIKKQARLIEVLQKQIKKVKNL